MRFDYQAEKFERARYALMLPHSAGEPSSIADAFHEVGLAMHGLDRSILDDEASSLMCKLDVLMDTSEISDPDGVGLYLVKAKSLSHDEKVLLSNVIDELAHWFGEP